MYPQKGNNMERYDISVVENAVNTSSICQVNLYDKVIASCMKDYLEYRKAEEQGLLLKLPCKVGTHIYIINHYWIDEGHICGLAECDDVDCACFKVYEDPDTYTMVAFNEFGQTWFLTEEEAERKLKELQG